MKDGDNLYLMNWRKISLPPSPSGIPEPLPWVDALNEIYKENDRPQGFCVYLTLHESGRTIYFSPVAVKFCGRFFSDITYSHEFYECDAPLGANLLVGDFDSLDCLRLLNSSS